MNEDELKAIRHHLHQHPELSGKEKNTREFILHQLEKTGVEDIKTLADTGIIATFSAAEPGPCILIRADIDALPIEEENEFSYRSESDKISHKCGHDGHTTILIGLADSLQQQPIKKGKLVLLFQPAEETGSGAAKVLEDPAFDIQPDLVFALHNLPGYPLHQVVCRRGSFTSSVKSLIIKLRGKTSHAAEPEKGINPGLAIAEILQLRDRLSLPDPEDANFALISLIHVLMGEKAYGVSAGYGEVHLTLRTWTNERMKELEHQLLRELEGIGEKHQLGLETEFLEVFHANQNNDRAFEVIKKAAEKADLKFEERPQPFRWGEDFGLFTERFPGAMFGLGAGENTPALHNPDYDFPDALLPTGVRMFRGIIDESLQ